jgi:hypothetical protein
MQAAAFGLDDEIDVHGGAAESGGFVAGVKIVVAVGAAKRQIEVRVNIDPARHQVLARAVDEGVPMLGNIAADQRNHFTFDKDIRLDHIGGGDERATLKESTHNIFLSRDSG